MSAPSSTYRLQLRPGFGFAEAQALVPYLRDLGVGAVYVSPVLDATPGSTHGYDVTDPTQARPELGGPEGWDAFTATVREAGLGLVVDVVPNHMSVEVPRANPWWWSVLAEGEASPWAGHFDVDWSRGRLLVPVLGDDADVAELALDGDELTYDDHRFPIDAGTLADPSFASMTPQQVHDRQHYELVGWRRGGAELNYRRFFDITTLAAVRVEDEQVFDDTHREVLRWVEEGRVTGLRIDHPDGLSDPGGYLRRLHEAAPDAWLVVEKILHPGEELPTTWPVDGTTGYDAMREVAGVLLDRGGNGRGGEAPWQTLTERLGAPADYAAVEEDARRMVTRKVLVAEVRRIAALVRDVHQDAARTAVAETMVAFGVYRSYLPEAGREAWDAAIERARTRRPDVDPAIRALDAQVTEEPTGELATRIQQTSGMVVAKGTEDTTFYRFTRFAALNEVGGSPDVWGVDVDGFHALAAAREADHPTAMTALTTHDTKRSEDTRARMLTLAELGEEVMRELERRVILSVLDRKWREHLYEMDYLREGIYLRAYSQRDPLVEYQREGFDMFAAVMDGIKEETVGYLFNVQVTVEEDEDADYDEDDENVLVVDPSLRSPVGQPHIHAKGLDAPTSPANLTYSAPDESGEAEVRRDGPKASEGWKSKGGKGGAKKSRKR